MLAAVGTIVLLLSRFDAFWTSRRIFCSQWYYHQTHVTFGTAAGVLGATGAATGVALTGAGLPPPA